MLSLLQESASCQFLSAQRYAVSLGVSQGEGVQIKQADKDKSACVPLAINNLTWALAGTESTSHQPLRLGSEQTDRQEWGSLCEYTSSHKFFLKVCGIKLHQLWNSRLANYLLFYLYVNYLIVFLFPCDRHITQSLLRSLSLSNSSTPQPCLGVSQKIANQQMKGCQRYLPKESFLLMKRQRPDY